MGCTYSPFGVSSTLQHWGPDRFATLYQLVEPDDCPDCNGAPIEIKSMSYRSRNVGGDPVCTYDVEVAVFGVAGGACPAPDENVVICPPTTVTVNVPASNTADIIVSLPDGCCISGPAFVRLRWPDTVTCNSAGIHPFVSTTANTCVPCEQYFTTATTFYTTLTELCSNTHGASNMTTTIDAQCCMATPTHDHSWGRVKTMYR
jgi:hypothetical protein